MYFQVYSKKVIKNLSQTCIGIDQNVLFYQRAVTRIIQNSGRFEQ